MMLRHPKRLLSLAVLAVSFAFATEARSGSSSTPVVSPMLIDRAQSEGQVRVLVRLAAIRTPELWLESDLEINSRRATIQASGRSVRAMLGGLSHRVVREFEDFPYVALSVGAEGLRALEGMAGTVAEIIEDKLHHPFLAESAPLVQAGQAWAGAFAATSLDGAGTVIAVIDSGVDTNHPFLGGKVVEEACFSSNDAENGATSLCPGGVEASAAPGSGLHCAILDCEHGTHVAGIAAGDGQNGVVAPFSGIAKGANIMAIQVFSRFVNPVCAWVGAPAPCILAFTSDIMAALQQVYDRRNAHNFAAINLSIGGASLYKTACDNDPLKPIIDLLRAANIATVIAAGNDGSTNSIASPACISSAVSVGSTSDGSAGGAAADSISSFSDNAAILSVLAPGQWINSSVPGGDFDTFAGTSMAAPHVSGAFAILKQAAPTATVSQMLSALRRTGTRVTDTRSTRRTTKRRIAIVNALNEIPAVQFSSPTYSVNERNSKATITVTRTGVPVDVLTVQYATSDGTATNGVDYRAIAGTLTFGPNTTRKTLTIPITTDSIDEAHKTVLLTLSNPNRGILGAQTSAVLTIIDNDAGGRIAFSAATYRVSERKAVATITVERVGGKASGVTIDYAAADGTATSGSDYTAVSGTLVFGAGQFTKTFTVPIVQDAIHEAGKTVLLSLSNPTGGATLGAITSAALTIVDDDPAAAP